jgi:hypothetical protein
MKRRLPILVLVMIAVMFTAGLYWLYQLRISGGDVFPRYSSLRADPLGTRGFYEALDALPELDVGRSLQPLEKLQALPPRTIILAGMNRHRWEAFPTRVSNALDSAVRAGSRVVVLFTAEQERVDESSDEEQTAKPVESQKPEKIGKDQPSNGRLVQQPCPR